MPVEEHGGRTRPVQPVAVHVGMHAGDLEHLDVLDAGVAECLHHRVRGAAHLLGRKARGRHAGDAAEIHQRVLPVIEPRVQIGERLPNDAAGLRHAHTPTVSDTSSSASAARTPSDSTRRCSTWAAARTSFSATT
jgi:hypothetical protein